MRRLLATCALAFPFSGSAQPAASPSLDSLAHAVAAGTTRFADRRVAVTAGYRRIGPDFPGMGEHWLNIGALLTNTFDASKPTLLIYAQINGAPRLLGAGFVVTTNSDSVAPNVPGWPNAWHEHSGLLVDESGVAPSHRSASGTRVWVLHIWTVLRNPENDFLPDNWALPFARLGMAIPNGVDADAGRALALIDGGDAYVRDVLSDAGLRTGAKAAAVDAAIEAARARVALLVQERPADLVTPLRNIWREMSLGLRTELGPAVDPYLAPPHGVKEHHHAGGPQ